MRKLIILGEYIAHLALGAAMFASLLLFGGAVNCILRWSEPIIGDHGFTGLMKIVEQVILITDMAFIVWWAVISTFATAKELGK